MRREAQALESTPMELRTTFRKHGTRRTKVTSFTKAMDGANVLELKQKPDPEKTWTGWRSARTIEHKYARRFNRARNRSATTKRHGSRARALLVGAWRDRGGIAARKECSG